MKTLFQKNPAILGVLGLLLLLLAVGFIFNEDFRSVRNLQNVYEQSAPLAFVSLGQTVVILTRGIDLSLDAQIALLSSLASGLIDNQPERVLPVVLGALVLGTFIGVINGALIVILRIHALIITLGMAAILQGCALLYTLSPVGGIPIDYDFFAYGRVAGIPVGTTVAVLLFIVVGLFLKYTRLGRQIFAFGGDPHAATMVGIRTTRVTLFTYGLAGFLTAVTAIYLVSRLGVGNPVADGGFNLGSITAVVIGGTMLTGGRGSVLGTLLGVFLVQLLNNLLNFMDVSTFYQWMIQGAIVVVAVSLYIERKRTPQ
ncbi:MAG: ABC transporter permease [Rhizobiaceae bacterium]|nr:ABC transporter permease [Rhizobiaceae bacterium]